MKTKVKQMPTHEDWMRLALDLAKATEGQTAPNPMVGAVVVKEGRLLGTGVHLQAGTPHAEVHALRMAGEAARGSTVYVTLEPCNHYGRTPPCTEAILQAGVSRVVVGSVDPDPRVAGRGIARLRSAGVEVLEGVLEEECLRLNEAYFHHRRTGRPFVTLKMAMTLDGKIATASGDSRWVTGESARKYVHELRNRYQAILVGVGTGLADRPQLTTRLEHGGKQPIRIIVDSHLRTPLDAPVTDTSLAPTWIFTTEQKDPEKERALIDKGVRVISTGEGPLVDWDVLFEFLGKEGILSVLVEGGSEVNASLLKGNHVQKVIAFVAPKILGGQYSKSAVGGESPETMAEAIPLRNVTTQMFGQDLCITGYIARAEDEDVYRNH
jgi:diaminohydroxyphosphoribosylaminopyrimidine deaminase / 5-amino-6-(5-phosphoribosylamino)uracil reductase